MEIKVCIGDYCHLHGAETIVQMFQALLQRDQLAEQIHLKGCFCMRRCKDPGVSVQVGATVHKVEPEQAATFFETVIRPSLQR